MKLSSLYNPLHFLQACFKMNRENQNYNTESNRSNLIEPDYLDKICCGDQVFRKDIINELIIQIPENILKMEVAIQQNLFTEVHSVAHDLKTNVFILGLSKLIGEPLQSIETLSLTASTMTEIETLFAGIKSVCQVAIVEAKQMAA